MRHNDLQVLFAHFSFTLAHFQLICSKSTQPYQNCKSFGEDLHGTAHGNDYLGQKKFKQINLFGAWLNGELYKKMNFSTPLRVSSWHALPNLPNAQFRQIYCHPRRLYYIASKTKTKRRLHSYWWKIPAKVVIFADFHRIYHDNEL